MSYIECPECGHKALSAATRCPRCGHAFPARPLQRADAGRRRDWPSALLAATIVIGAIVVVATLRRPADRQPGARVSAIPAGLPGPARSSGSDTARVPPRGPALAPDDTGMAAPLVGRAGGLVTRYARTWANVRDGRARETISVGVLSPGEQVLVDSLRSGWYRVLADGQTLGYVHRSNLEAVPPSPRP